MTHTYCHAQSSARTFGQVEPMTDDLAYDPSTDEPQTSEQIRQRIGWLGKRFQDAKCVVGERYPSRTDATEEEQDAARDFIQTCEPEIESLRQLLRYKQTLEM